MKKAFTLIELLVYMAILGFIIVVAGRVFSDSTGMRIRTQSMTKATEEVNKVATLLKEDMNQMGARAWFDGQEYKSVDKVYINALGGDHSSFQLWHGEELQGGNDRILFRKMSYDQDGRYIGVREIEWTLGTDKILRRSCKTIDKSANYNATLDPESNVCPDGNADPVIMAIDVQTFSLKPSSPKSQYSFGGAPTAPLYDRTFTLLSRQKSSGDEQNETIISQTSSGLNTATLSFSARNINSSGSQQHQIYVGDAGNISPNFNTCHRFTFNAGETYEVKFKTPMNMNAGVPDSMMALFNPALDHIALGFRTSNGESIAALPVDFMFYPPLENSADAINQGFEFSVPSDVLNACAVFTFAFYSGSDTFGPHKGKIKIKDFELRQKTESYVFDPDPAKHDYATETSTDTQKYQHKKNVKAFELVLEINKRGETSSTRASNDVGGYIIPTPNNGIVPQ